MKSQRVAAFGFPPPRRRLTAKGDLLAVEARLVADYGAGAALAFQAVAHRGVRRFTFNRKAELPATAGGASGGHRFGSASINMGECKADYHFDHEDNS
jgi:hypothetical protein